MKSGKVSVYPDIPFSQSKVTPISVTRSHPQRDIYYANKPAENRANIMPRGFLNIFTLTRAAFLISRGSSDKATTVSADISGPGQGSNSSSGSNTITIGTGWTRVETPVIWNYTLTKASRSACGASEGKLDEIGPGKTYANPRDLP
jgi:hypothetical protein